MTLEFVAIQVAFTGRVGVFDAFAIAISAALILAISTRLVVEAARGPAAVPPFIRAGTGPLLTVFTVCVVARLALVGLGLY